MKRGNREGKVVGTTGFEPATSWSQTRCSTRLSYVPPNPMPAVKQPGESVATVISGDFRASRMMHDGPMDGALAA